MVASLPIKRLLQWRQDHEGRVAVVRAELSARGLLPHFHDTWSFGLILSGRCRFQSGGRVYHANTGDVFAIPPFELHGSASATSDSVHYAVAYLDADWLGSRVRNADPADWMPGSRRVWQRPVMASRLAALLEVATPGAGELAGMVDLFSRLGVPGEAIRAPAPPAVKALCRLFQHSWLEPLPLSGVSDGLGCSRAHLIRQFRRHTGTAPGAYLRQLRCMKARHLLMQRVPLADIAHALHFADQAHFSREFKKVFGVPPGEFARVSSQADDVPA